MKITEEKSPDSDIMAGTQIIYLFILLYLLTQISRNFCFLLAHVRYSGCLILSSFLKAYYI